MIDDYELNKARYYPSKYRLTDGRIATFGGQSVFNPTEFVPEPFEINPNKLTLLTAWQMPVDDNWAFLNYPHLYTLSSNEWFFAGPSRHNGGGGNGGRDNYNTFYFDLSNPNATQVPYGGKSELWEGASVMYKPGKILKAGGVEALDAGYSHHSVEATEHAERIDAVISESNKWTYAASMHRKRVDHNMVILPDGRVFSVGGAKYHHFNLRKIEANWVQDGEIWNPANNTWALTAAFGGGQYPTCSEVIIPAQS